MHHKLQSYDVWFLRYGAQQTEFFVILNCFLVFYLLPYGPRKSKFWKNKKKIIWRYHFTKVYHKWSSYDIWFLRYGVQQTEFFVILDCFLPFYPLTTWKIKILKKWKKAWRYYHLTQVCHKWQSNDLWFLRYQVRRTEFFVILNHFLPLYPPNNPKNQNLENMKKTPGDIIILHMCTTNDNHMGKAPQICTVSFLQCFLLTKDDANIYVHH